MRGRKKESKGQGSSEGQNYWNDSVFCSCWFRGVRFPIRYGSELLGSFRFVTRLFHRFDDSPFAHWFAIDCGSCSCFCSFGLDSFSSPNQFVKGTRPKGVEFSFRKTDPHWLSKNGLNKKRHEGK